MEDLLATLGTLGLGLFVTVGLIGLFVSGDSGGGNNSGGGGGGSGSGGGGEAGCDGDGCGGCGD